MAGLRDFAACAPVHGECGGYMLLGRSIEDADGIVHPMAGLLPVDTNFAKRKMSLGYRQARLTEPARFGDAAPPLRGHDTHYAPVVSAHEVSPSPPLPDAAGPGRGPPGHHPSP